MNSSQLMDRYGYDSVAIGQTFPDAKTMSCFLRDYAMVHGKSLKMDAASGGNRKIFICSDDKIFICSDDCHTYNELQ